MEVESMGDILSELRERTHAKVDSGAHEEQFACLYEALAAFSGLPRPSVDNPALIHSSEFDPQQHDATVFDPTKGSTAEHYDEFLFDRFLDTDPPGHTYISRVFAPGKPDGFADRMFERKLLAAHTPEGTEEHSYADPKVYFHYTPTLSLIHI